MVILIPRPLPDFILKLWRKIGIKSGSGLGTKLRHGDVMAGVKGVQSSITFVVLEIFYFFFVACTGAGICGALEVQSSNSNTKVSRVQVHSLSEGSSQSTYFHSPL